MAVLVAEGEREGGERDSGSGCGSEVDCSVLAGAVEASALVDAVRSESVRAESMLSNV